jgi:hypothetical protein
MYIDIYTDIRVFPIDIVAHIIDISNDSVDKLETKKKPGMGEFFVKGSGKK